MRRRALLASVGVTALASGCLGSLESSNATGTDPESSTDASTAASTTTTAPATSTTEPCSVPDGLGVPDVDPPEEVTEASAREVASFVEEALARERAAADGWTVSRVDYANTAVREAETGVFVKASVSLDAAESAERADGTATTLVASLFYAGWYHVTATRVRRAPGRDVETPPSEGWTTVACD